MHNEELQQKLWEFVYDLLPDDQARELTDQITSDPEIARAYAEIKLQSEVVAEAVRVPAEVVPLEKPVADRGPVVLKPAAWGAKPQKAQPRRSRSWGNSLSAAAAGILVCALGISLGRQAWLTHQANQIAQAPRDNIVAVTPWMFAPDAKNVVTVQVTDNAQQPISEDIRFRAKNSKEETVWAETVRANSDGLAQFALPVDKIDDFDHFYLSTDKGSAENSIRGEFRLGRRQRFAHLETDGYEHRLYEPVQFGLRVLDRAQGDPVSGIETNTELVDPQSGMTLAAQPGSTDEHGVVSGQLSYDNKALAEGEYVVRVSGNNNEFPAQEQTVAFSNTEENAAQLDLEFGRRFFQPNEQVTADVKVVTRDGLPVANATIHADVIVNGTVQGTQQLNTNADGQAKLVTNVPATLGMGIEFNSFFHNESARLRAAVPLAVREANIQFFPEGGSLVADLPNRVYFQAVDAEHQPVEINGRLVDSHDNVVTELHTNKSLNVGRGLFELIPTPGNVYRVELDEPAGWIAMGQMEPTLSIPAALQVENSVLAPNESLRLRLAATGAEREMVLVATSQGVEVSHTAIKVFGNGQPINVAMPLSEEAEGAVRVVLFDYGTVPARAIAERLVYREPKQKLQITTNASDWFAGQSGEVQVQVQDSLGKPVAANIDVTMLAVGEQELARHPPGLPAHYWLLGEIDSPNAWDDVNGYLDGSKRAQRQLELLLGAQRPRSIADRTMLAASYTEFDGVLNTESTASLIDDSGSLQAAFNAPQLLTNRDAIAEQEAMASRLRSSAQQWLANSGRVIVILALASLIVALLLAALQKADARYWGTTLGFSTATLLLAALLIGKDVMHQTGRGGLAKMVHNSESVTESKTDSAAHGTAAPGTAGPKSAVAEIEQLQPDSRSPQAMRPSDMNPPMRDESAPEVPAPPAPREAPGAGVPPSPSGRADAAPDAFSVPGLAKDGSPAAGGASRGGGVAAGGAGAGFGGGGSIGGFGAADPAPRHRAMPKSRARNVDRSPGASDRSAEMRGGIDSTADKDLADQESMRRLDSDMQEREDSNPAQRVEQSEDTESPEPASDAQLALQQQPTESLSSTTPAEPSDVRAEEALVMQAPAESLAAEIRSARVLIWQRSVDVNSDGVKFPVKFPEKPTYWKLLVTAHSEEGLGEFRQQGVTQDPTAIVANIPDRMSLTDTIDAPVELQRETKLGAQHANSALLLQNRGIGGRDYRRHTLSMRYGYLFGESNSSTFNLWRASIEPPVWKRVRVTADRYPLVQHFAGHMQHQEDLQIDLPNYQPGTPVHVTLRIYPSLAAEVLDAVRGVQEPVLHDSTYAALQRAQTWMNDNRVADVQAMRGVNTLLAKEETLKLDASISVASAAAEATFGIAPVVDSDFLKRFVDSRGGRGLDESKKVLESLRESDQQRVLDQLADIQDEDGRVEANIAATASTTALAAGQPLRISKQIEQIDSTAIAVLAWSQDPVKYQTQIQQALNWLRRQRTGDGTWPTEDANAVALMAFCSLPTTEEVPEFEVHMVSGSADVPLTAPAGTNQPLVWSDELPVEGGQIKLSLIGPAERMLPYAVRVDYAAEKPVVSQQAPLKISTSLNAPVVTQGEQVTLNVTIEGTAEPTVAARISIPAGLRLVNTPFNTPHGWIEGDLVLYFKSPFAEPADWVKAPDRLQFELYLTALHAGRFTAPAARVYPENAPELISWGEPLEVEVQGE